MASLSTRKSPSLFADRNVNAPFCRISRTTHTHAQATFAICESIVLSGKASLPYAPSDSQRPGPGPGPAEFTGCPCPVTNPSGTVGRPHRRPRPSSWCCCPDISLGSTQSVVQYSPLSAQSLSAPPLQSPKNHYDHPASQQMHAHARYH